MKDETDLTGIKTLRLFPLPGFVLFPHSIVPLHIFEPRYRQMTEDALASDCLVTIVMVRPGGMVGVEAPKLEGYGCVGRILKHERLSDGRYNMLLLGLKRVRLLREIPAEKLYRIAQVEMIEDAVEGCDERLRAGLLADFRRYLGPTGTLDPDFETIIASDISFGILVDILAHSLTIEPSMKQRLLEEYRVHHRVEALRAWLVQQIDHQQSGSSARGAFQPPFSRN